MHKDEFEVDLKIISNSYIKNYIIKIEKALKGRTRKVQAFLEDAELLREFFKSTQE